MNKIFMYAIGAGLQVIGTLCAFEAHASDQPQLLAGAVCGVVVGVLLCACWGRSKKGAKQ